MEGLTPFQHFINLIKFDEKSRDALKKVEVLKKELALQHTQRSDLVLSIDILKNNLQETQKEVNLQELRMASLAEKEKAKKEQQANAFDSREYASLKKEIDNLKLSQHEHESELVTSWNKLEVAKRDYEMAQTELASKLAEIDILIEAKNKQLADVLEQMESFKAERQQLLAGLPQEWLEKYDIMHLQVSNPVVPLIGYGCSACFYDVTRQDYLELQKKKLLQCKGCFRLLYLNE